MSAPQPAYMEIDLQDLQVAAADVEDAAGRLLGVVHRTPVMTSRTWDELAGAEVFFKCENLQRSGAFKIRGAYNALSRLSDEERRLGVLSYSSGNHAQALALAGRLLRVDVRVVMPSDAPRAKVEATRGYGAMVVPYDRAVTTREALAGRLAEQTGRTVIPPYDHPHIVAGQGTAGWELFEDLKQLDLLLVPCGGGGLLSGCGIAAAASSSGCRVVGVEPEKAADAAASYRSRVLHRVDDPDTVADGARTPHLGRVTFPLVLRYVHDMVTVTDEAILWAMRFLWERMKLVVEPTGAMAAAALLESRFAGAGRIGVILSGGNLDLGRFGTYFAE